MKKFTQEDLLKMRFAMGITKEHMSDEEFAIFLQGANKNGNVNVGFTNGLSVSTIQRELNKDSESAVFFMPFQYDDVMNFNIKPIDKLFKVADAIRKPLYQKILISFNGFDNDRRELYEIDEAKKYIKKLVTKRPQLLYYINMEACYDFLFACLADEIMTIRNTEDTLSSHELYKKYTQNGLEIPRYKTRLTVKTDTIESVSNRLTDYGIKVNDVQGVAKIIKLIDSVFPSDRRI